MEKNQMSFWDHFEELRGRLIWCAWIFILGFAGFYFFSDHLLDFLRRPLFKYLPQNQQHLYYTGLFENFFVHLRVAGFTSLVLLSPIYFFILWGFISPGLHPKEKHKIIPFLIASSVFFLGGTVFAYAVLLPSGIQYFLNYGTQAEVAWLTLDHYISTVIKILLGFGVAFELPVILILLASIGLISPEKLIQHRKTALIFITIISALVAPPDAISMLLLMVPLYLLFEGSIIVIRLIQKNKLNPINTN